MGLRNNLPKSGKVYYICRDLNTKELYKFSDGDRIFCFEDHGFRKVLGANITCSKKQDCYIDGWIGFHFNNKNTHLKQALMFCFNEKLENMNLIEVPQKDFIVLVVKSKNEFYFYDHNLKEIKKGKELQKKEEISIEEVVGGPIGSEILLKEEFKITKEEKIV